MLIVEIHEMLKEIDPGIVPGIVDRVEAGWEVYSTPAGLQVRLEFPAGITQGKRQQAINAIQTYDVATQEVLNRRRKVEELLDSDLVKVLFEYMNSEQNADRAATNRPPKNAQQARQDIIAVIAQVIN